MNYTFDELVCNVKFTIILSENMFTPVKSREKKFYIFDKFHVTVYKHTPKNLNVTGFRELNLIPKIISEIETFFSVKCLTHKIDCVMLSYKGHSLLRLNNVINHSNLYSENFYIDYNPELFNGLHLKAKIPHINHPSLNLFHTGSFQIFGKDIDKIKNALIILEKLFPLIS